MNSSSLDQIAAPATIDPAALVRAFALRSDATSESDAFRLHLRAPSSGGPSLSASSAGASSSSSHRTPPSPRADSAAKPDGNDPPEAASSAESSNGSNPGTDSSTTTDEASPPGTKRDVEHEHGDEEQDDKSAQDENADSTPPGQVAPDSAAAEVASTEKPTDAAEDDNHTATKRESTKSKAKATGDGSARKPANSAAAQSGALRDGQKDAAHTADQAADVGEAKPGETAPAARSTRIHDAGDGDSSDSGLGKQDATGGKPDASGAPSSGRTDGQLFDTGQGQNDPASNAAASASATSIASSGDGQSGEARTSRHNSTSARRAAAAQSPTSATSPTPSASKPDTSAEAQSLQSAIDDATTTTADKSTAGAAADKPGDAAPTNPTAHSEAGSAAAAGGGRFSQQLVSQARQPAGEGPQLSSTDHARFVNRVARAFHSLGEGGGELRLRLSPPHLGSLRLEVKVHNGALSAHIEAETPAARTVLLDNLHVLRERLAEQNIRVEHFDVDLADRQPGGLPDDPRHARHDEPGPHRATTGERSEDSAAVAGPQQNDAGPRLGDANQLNVIV